MYLINHVSAETLTTEQMIPLGLIAFSRGIDPEIDKKTYESHLVGTERFWNNIHQARL
jgi:hypothetical protein